MVTTMSNNDIIINMATELRPRTFSDMVGQPYASGVGRQIGKGKVSGQGYILVGPKGCGKTTLARIIAKSLNCENRDKDTGDPCGDCSSCKSHEAGVSRYIDEINSAAYRGINDIKSKIENMNQSIPDGCYRVYIIDEAHMLTKDAFSALLKPLEEHADNVVFIFTTTNPEVIPETIISRSPIIPIRPLSDDDLREILSNVIDNGKKTNPDDWSRVTDNDIEQAILSAHGSARQAITSLSGIVFHGVQSPDNSVEIDTLCDKFISGSTSGVLSAASCLLSEKSSDPTTVITMLIHKLFSEITRNKKKSPSLSRQVANLSSLIGEVTSSTPSVIVAAKIAACVSVPEIDMEKCKTENNDGIQKFFVYPDTEIDDVMNYILYSGNCRKHLGKKWISILDDMDKSDIRITMDGFLLIVVDNPTEKLRQALNNCFDKVIVRSFED